MSIAMGIVLHDFRYIKSKSFEICGEIRKSKNLIKSLYLCFTAAHFVTGL